MPVKLSRGDRRLLLWAAAIFFPIIVALAFLSTSNSRDSGIPSSYSSDPSGAKAAYLLLHDLGYRAERWGQSPTDLPREAKNTVLVLAMPFTLPAEEEKEALKLYLARGGRILATGRTVDIYVPGAQTVPELVPAPDPLLYQPQLVSPLTRAGAIRMAPTAYWKDRSTAYLVHYAGDDRPVVLSYGVGEGAVIWWAASTPLSNAGIASEGNLVLLLNSLGPPGQTRVLWDEYFHSSRRTVASYILEKPVLFGLAQLSLLALALLLTYSRRNSPIYPSDEPSRLSPLEFVETLGGLYRRAHAVRSALEVPYTRFRTQAVRHLGLKSEITNTDLARAIRNRLGYKNDGLEDLLQRIETALYDPELKESKALELVQELDSHARRLQLSSSLQQETVSHASSLAGPDPRKN